MPIFLAFTQSWGEGRLRWQDKLFGGIYPLPCPPAPGATTVVKITDASWDRISTLANDAIKLFLYYMMVSTS